jgi:hypothetical protein
MFVSALGFSMLVCQFLLFINQDTKNINTINYQTVTLNELILYPKFYDGKNVQFETYLYLCDHDYFEKPRLCFNDFKNGYDPIGFIKINSSKIKPSILQKQFTMDEGGISKNRIKVIIKGEAIDYCKVGIFCDAGRLLFIKAQEVIRLEPAEDFDYWK